MVNNKHYTRHIKSYAHYSGMAFQMGAIIAGAAFGGIKLDQWLKLSPLFTVICSLLGVVISMYLIIKDFIPKDDKKNEKNSN